MPITVMGAIYQREHGSRQTPRRRIALSPILPKQVSPFARCAAPRILKLKKNVLMIKRMPQPESKTGLREILTM